MSIVYDENHHVFKLDTPHTSYVMALADQKWLGHVYYGEKIDGTDLDWALSLELTPHTPDRLPREAVTFYDCFPTEYSLANIGDFREPCLAVRTAEGQIDCLPLYTGYEITPGKPKLDGLPAAFGGEGECATLKIVLTDERAGVRVELYYTAFEDVDAITRSVRVSNTGVAPLRVERALSACLELPFEPDMDYVTLHGSWARERGIFRAPIAHGFQGTASKRGISSHQEHPFLAVTGPGTTQEQGQVWAMNFVYSGDFLAQVERGQFDNLRLVMGIHPENFSWVLEPGGSFQTPEAVLIYSGAGLGGMTRTFHDLYRTHLIRSPWLYRHRPVLINNWEATYFDFDEEKLLKIAGRAAQLGVELFVLDDGWFGDRHTDSGHLGDWWNVDRRKLPHGLEGLAERVETLGMKFGLWMEPEMVSPNSRLYEDHPDWAIRTASRQPGLARDQLVLDIGRPEVAEYVWQQLSHTLHSAKISYLKWDMNRPLADLGSAGLPPERQGEVSHRYTLGLYWLQERLLEEFPNLLLENCCSGGGRFDPGMLFYSPQIWCSDDTDGMERLAIQEGTAMLYPLSTIGAHVSACPNEILKRSIPFNTRAVIAGAGTFGYELDVTALSLEDQQAIPAQIARYEAHRELLQRGDYYRLSSAGAGRRLDAYMVVSKDRTQALVTVVRVLGKANQRRQNLRLRGLEPEARYSDKESGASYTGSALMGLGLPIELEKGDLAVRQYVLIQTR